MPILDRDPFATSGNGVKKVSEALGPAGRQNQNHLLGIKEPPFASPLNEQRGHRQGHRQSRNVGVLSSHPEGRVASLRLPGSSQDTVP